MSPKAAVTGHDDRMRTLLVPFHKAYRGLVWLANSPRMLIVAYGILILVCGSLYPVFEKDDTSLGDGIWWAVVTATTVGYGDQYPVTNEGRILGAWIIVVGVGIFGTFTGYLANLFLAPKPGDGPEPGQAAVDDTRERVAQLRVLLAEQQAAVDELDGLLSRKTPGPDV